MKLKSKELASIAIKLSLFSLIALPSTSAQETPATQNTARSLLNNSLDFLREKIESSNFALTEADLSQIERQGNTFLIPKYLRLKGIANIPIIERQVQVGRVRFNDPQSSNLVTAFKLLKIKSKSAIETLGLQTADIIYKINGDLVQTTNDATKIFNELKSRDEIEVSIIRNKSLVNYIFKFV